MIYAGDPPKIALWSALLFPTCERPRIRITDIMELNTI